METHYLPSWILDKIHSTFFLKVKIFQTYEASLTTENSNEPT